MGGAASIAMAAAGRAWAAPEGASRPNIVWIYSDDHAQNAVSAYGSRLAKVAPTPNIDRIAQEGILFNNSFVTNSICGPCRAVVLTGLHSHLNGFRKNGDRFDGAQRTFPKLLQQAGYQMALYGKWHLGTDPTGFDDWEVLPGQGHYYNPDFLTPNGKERAHGYVTDIITDKALDWLDTKRDPDKPFMLMVQHKAPHREWQPGPDHLTTFDDVEIPEPDNLFDDYAGRGSAAKLQDMTIEKTMRLGPDLKVWNEEPDEDSKGPWRRTFGRMNEQQRKDWFAAYNPKNKAFREANLQGKDLVRWKYQRYMKDYLRCIASVDDNVGRVLDYLEEKGLDKNTVVFYSSDQSFYLGEHGWFDKRFIYEESLRTPLLARWPGVTAPGSKTDRLVQNLDCAETFLDIAGVEVPADMQGRSLVPLMKGEPPADWRSSIYYHYYEGEGKVHNVYRHYGVRTERYKLVYFYTLDEWEFYDLQTDPQEMKSEYDNPAYAQQVAALKTELARLRKHYAVPEDTDARKG
ncbi:MAG: sulfatase-like hydrolase/transferase [Nitrospiraceae bacterium]|nr:sulfatase-like hydrolase/transferase [Nitrospiraceae bacterium]